MTFFGFSSVIPEGAGSLKIGKSTNEEETNKIDKQIKETQSGKGGSVFFFWRTRPELGWAARDTISGVRVS